MLKLNKILWTDGMFIHPQHFQQQDSYYENLLINYTDLHSAYNFGINMLEIDESYLKLNKILIRKAAGLFPNGILFSIDQNAPVTIDIPNNYSNKSVYLGLSLHNNYMLDNLISDQKSRKNPYIRYYGVEEELKDSCQTSRQVKSILTGKLNINLFLEDDDLEQLILLPIAKILDAHEGVNIDKAYIPPCLTVAGSSILMSYISKVKSLLNNYIYSASSALNVEDSSKQLGKVENLLLLQTISRFKYLFDLLSKEPKLKPYTLFKHIISLIGSLIVFSKNSSLFINTDYDHLDLANSFNSLMNVANILFHELTSLRAVQVAFNLDVLEGYSIYTANLNNVNFLETAEIIIGIECGNIPPKQDNEVFLRSIKISAIQDIKRIITRQVLGVNYKQITTLPVYVTYDDKTIYFKISKDTIFWQQLTKDKDIGLYLGDIQIKVNNVTLWAIPSLTSEMGK